jgi:uracil-DNA glycosylase family protein
MAAATSAADFLPPRMTLAALRRAADGCRGCELYRHATQTVFGDGPRRAFVMVIGEMPGDQEDREGEPFVGPAGHLLDEALEAASLPRDEVYLTNAVKHFRWTPRGKRRMHKTPGARHVEACRPWLQAELLIVKPRLIVCLGATAAQALLGRSFRVSKQRGRFVASEVEVPVLATHHPAAVLRAPSSEDRAAKRLELVSDLKRVARRLRRLVPD